MKIKNIEKKYYNGLVYNFHCDPNENYYANKILVHNCYKKNGEDINTHHMTFSEFKNIFHKVADTEFKEFDDGKIGYRNNGLLQQIAFGICDIGSNPDFFKMMRYCREFGVIPNYTCHALDMTPEYAKLSAELCGAVAISIYNKEKSYNAVKMLADAGLKQINFHMVAYSESFDKIKETMNDMVSDERLIDNVKALVMLKYKPKGKNAGKFKQLSTEQMKTLIDYAEQLGIGIGFDSCSANAYLKAIKNNENYEQKAQCADPCESSCFSSYINCRGEFYACSFCENEGMWKDGINVLAATDFKKDVWENAQTQKFRDMLLKNERKCPMFNLDDEVNL